MHQLLGARGAFHKVVLPHSQRRHSLLAGLHYLEQLYCRLAILDPIHKVAQVRLGHSIQAEGLASPLGGQRCMRLETSDDQLGEKTDILGGSRRRRVD